MKALSTSKEWGIEMERRYPNKFDQKENRKLTVALMIVLFLPMFCLLTGALFFVGTLNLLNLFGVRIDSVGFRVLNYKLLLFKDSNPFALTRQASQEVH